MKKTDIAMLVLIASISVFASFLVANLVLGDPRNASEKVKTIERFSVDVEDPSKKIFNKEALNPTIEVRIQGCSKKIINGKDSQLCEQEPKTDNNQQDKKDNNQEKSN